MDELVPTDFYLSQNYPNPFKDKTTIKYCVPDITLIKMTVFDSDMNVITVLENEIKEAGTYELELDGSNFSEGTYFCQLRSKEFVDIKKMVIIR